MEAPIVLWNPKSVHAYDDAGIAISKTVLRPSLKGRRPPPYEIYAQQPRELRRVPRLAFFCIRALAEYPEQVHLLGPSRLHFSKDAGGHGILRALFPTWKTPDFSLLDVDPRMWATLVQVYANPPSLLASYPIQLADQHLRLLQQIPSTPNFALVTVLDLQRCNKLTDDSITFLKPLHNLGALDVSNTALTAHGINMFSSTLVFDEFGEKKGPWELRILRMRACCGMKGEVIGYLHRFPLLCIVDLRETQCSVKDIKEPFFQSENEDLFDSPMGDAIKYLAESNEETFTHDNPYLLSVQERPIRHESNPEPALPTPRQTFSSSMHGSFVVLPPSQGTSRPGRPFDHRIQFGNIDAIRLQEIKAEKEERLANRPTRRDSPDTEDSSGDDMHSSFEDESESSLCEEKMVHWFRRPRFDLSTLGMPGNGSRGILEESLTQNGSPVEHFYKPRPRTSPIRKPVGRVSKASSAVTLVRVPSPWYTLDSITPEERKKEQVLIASGSKRKLVDTKLHDKSEGKSSMRKWQAELVKRRRTAHFDDQSPEPTLVNGPSPPRSTSALCRVNRMVSGPALGLRPISTLRAAPRPSLTGKPRLKLEPDKKALPVKDKSTSASSGPERKIYRFPFRRTANQEPRALDLEEGFRLQAAKKPPEARKQKSALIKGASSLKDNGDLEPLDKKTQPDKPHSKTARSLSGGFDWGAWGNG
ncbi:hypothetical protein M0805_006033 [Coniferiporia weirii]|nr:hypothetical protein M0805_006033 [Coniferiporia weirii]